MEKGKDKASRKKRIIAQKYESDSDDEMPEAVSNADMKTQYETLSKEIGNLKEKVRQAEKAKRREKQEKYIAQKKAKLNSDRVEDEGNIKEAAELDNAAEMSAKETSVPARPTRKVYPSLNIAVEPLNNVIQKRASSAIDFKSRRLNKVPRESIKNAVISYQKKLQVRK